MLLSWGDQKGGEVRLRRSGGRSRDAVPSFHAPKDAAPSIKSAANGPSLLPSILDVHGREILERASDQFLDVAMALRLETINARDLVNLLDKAGRLGYSETDVDDDGEAVRPVDEVHQGARIRLDRNWCFEDA